MANVQETERTRLLLIGTALTFLLINFNRDLALPFIIIILLDMFAVVAFVGKKYQYYFSGGIYKDWMVSGFFMIIAYGAFMFIASTIVSTFDPMITGPASIVTHMAAQIPAFAGDKSLEFVMFSGFIPYVETKFFFGSLQEVLARAWGLGRVSITSIGHWIMVLAVSSIFTLFHASAKLGAGNTAFAVTFLFGVVSCWLVLHTRQTREAIGLHVVNNSVYSLAKMGVYLI